ncbi:mechanosensitive ion channel family protein [Polyangium aurulentum]|uniref:mechanosensitive ion channel family protein n=1 Tax=Polyangium aurulentum TaxID=2567896 RepID=UPI00146B9C0F|nr:mechanosensitive ion channel family protein [Polyangium aurulentum]UQA61964.1 mechanosensitive ion channel family protein [Polyangium aurulentum]
MFDKVPFTLLAAVPGVPPGWVIRYLPAWAYQVSVYGVAIWQWVALPVSFVLSLLAGRLLIMIVGRAAMPIAKRTKNTWDDDLLVALGKPASLLAGVGTFAAVVPAIALRKPADDVVHKIIDALALVGLFWAFFRILDLFADRLSARIAATRNIDPEERGGALSLVSTGSKTAKVVIVIFAVAVILGQLGVQVAGIIAGLGIGGIAVALAGQKTLENLFGFFTLGVDQPLHIGDFVKVDDFVGTVERVGLRSTRIRTLDRTIITLPNGRLADMRIENYTVRDRIRLYTRLGLLYSTKPSALRQILQDMRAYLAERPGIFKDAISVFFVELGDSALVVEIMVWLDTREAGDFPPWKEETLLGLMEIVEKNGSGFAFPTRTIHVDSMPAMPGAPPARAELPAAAPPS